MRKSIFLFSTYAIIAITLLISISCSDGKTKEPSADNQELRQKEIDLKKRELDLKERELSQKKSENLDAVSQEPLPKKSVPAKKKIQTAGSDFYIINVAAIKSEGEASKKAKELRSMGYDSDYLWIPDYNSLSGAQYYSVYIGPFFSQYECEVATEDYRQMHPEAYGLFVSQGNRRVQINGIGKVTVSKQ